MMTDDRSQPLSDMTELAERLKDACHGHPHAKIPWPHRILHEAAAAIERLDHECQASMATIASERARAEAAEAREKRLREALGPFSTAAGGVFTRNFNASAVLFRKPATAPHAESVVTAGHLFVARAALESKE